MPRFIPSSTKTSAWSDESDGTQGLKDVETQFIIGKETQAELRLLGNSPHADVREETSDQRGPDSNAKAASGYRANDTWQKAFSSPVPVRTCALELFWPRMSAPSTQRQEAIPKAGIEMEADQSTQDLAATQLLNESRATMNAAETDPKMSSALALQLPPARIAGPSQATTVEASPMETQWLKHSAKADAGPTSATLISLSLQRPLGSAIVQNTDGNTAIEADVPSSPIKAAGVFSSSPAHPPSLQPSSLPDASACAAERADRPSITLLELGYDENSMTPTELLPESLMNDSIPRPPSWADGQED